MPAVKKRITVRQRQALWAIYEIFRRTGRQPTISELRQSLEVSRDQAVLDLLARLERGGLISRDAGKARSIRLTRDGCVAIGLSPNMIPGEVGSFGTLPSILDLTPTQHRVANRLSAIDPRLSQMYSGALRVLQDEANSERIAQSAHSVREMTHKLSDMAKDLLDYTQKKQSKNQRDSNARQLERLFDPLGGTKGIIDPNVYDTWNAEFHQFFIQASHHAREVLVDEYVAKLREFEEFLITYVLPLQTEIYLRLDETLTGEPELCDPVHLRILLSRNLESYRYFLRKADARWLPFLREHSLLKPSWDTGEYLTRVAAQRPEEVMQVILATPEDEDLAIRTAVRRSFIQAAIGMPSEIAERLVDKIKSENWCRWPGLRSLAPTFTEYCSKLIQGRFYASAFTLASELVDAHVSTIQQYANAYNDHYYSEQFLQVLLSVPGTDAEPFIRLLVTALGRRIALEQRDKAHDHSELWRPAVEEHEQNWLTGDIKAAIVSTLRELLEKYIITLGPTALVGAKLDELLTYKPHYSIFTRLKLHLFRTYPDLAGDNIARVLFHYIDDHPLWHEYSLLLRVGYPLLSESARKGYLALLDAGPKDEKTKRYIDHWQLRRLTMIKEHLSPEELTKYSDLLSEQQQPEHPEFLSHHGLSWIGPLSPVDASTLSPKPTDELVQYLIAWEPSGSWFAPSREGLGRELSTLVKDDPGRFSHDAKCFDEPRLSPIYLYHFFFGLRMALRESRRVDWEAVLDLADSIVFRAPAVIQRPLDVDDMENNGSWFSVFQELNSLVEAGLNLKKDGPAFAARERIWKIIEFGCELDEPGRDRAEEFSESTMDPFTASINCARGTAFHALFSYIFWCDRNLNGSSGRGEARVPSEAKCILEKHLDPEHDPSVAIRSVYGRFFPWLYIYDPAWGATLIDAIFPDDHMDRRYAAWSAYLDAFPFEEVFLAMKRKYDLVISELRAAAPVRERWRNPKERLSHHMIAAYLYRWDEHEGSTWRRFFRVADAKNRGAAVAFAGRAYLQRDPRGSEKYPDDNRLQELWEWRLANTDDPDELIQFGWWVRPKRLDDGWQLQMLLKTLNKTNGLVEPDFEVLKALKQMVVDNPFLTVRVLDALVRSRRADRTLLMQEEIAEVLRRALDARDASQMVEALVDHLTKLGFEAYRSILEVRREIGQRDAAAVAL